MRRIALLLTAAIGAAALFAFFYPSMMVNAADVATPVEGEDFTSRPPTGTSIVTDTTLYSNDQALKFSQDVIASHSVTCTAVCDVQLTARGGQSGGPPTLKVNGAAAQEIANSGSVQVYTFDVNLPATTENQIDIRAANTGTGRNAFLDLVSFPASAGTDTTPPETTITSGPSGSLTGTTATFEFTSNETGSTFQCRLLPLESSRTSCSSPKTYTNLTVGTAYTFKVWAKDSAGNIDASPATRTFTPSGGTDTTPPNVTIDSGPGDTSDGAATFTFSADEPATFECKLLQGSTTISNWAACPSPKTYSGLADGDYRFRVRGIDPSNNVSVISSRTFTVTNSGGGGASEILVGAGDISSGGETDQQTGNVVRDQLSRGAWGVFTTGDNAYPDGTFQNYLVYDAAWGDFKDKTRPTYGNHDYYGSKTAAGSEEYWKSAPKPTPVYVSNEKSFYAYNIGNSNWRAIVLNSASSEGPTGNLAPPCKDDPTQTNDQMDFLNGELNTTKNTVLFWHHARFSSSSDHPTSEGDDGCSKTFFDVAHDNGADLVVQGHSHVYERYHTRDKDGAKVPSGLTSIVCGTGGNGSDGLQGSPNPIPDVKFTNAWGVCKLTLNANNAQVTFLSAPEDSPPGSDSATVAVRP